MLAATLVWFRLDLRLADNPALHAAAQRGGAIVPVFIWAPDEEGDWAPGSASRWWLHQSLAALAQSLEARGSRLIMKAGPSDRALREVAVATGADAVYWNRRYEPDVMRRDDAVEASLRTDGLATQTFNSALLHEPWTVQNKSRKPFQVFTPFWKHCLAKGDPPKPLRATESLPIPSRWPKSLPLAALELEPKIDWDGGIRAAWQPGEDGAKQALSRFLSESFADYRTARDLPAIDGTSRLSPHLHFGEIGPRQIWHALERHAARRRLPRNEWRESQYLTELGWREFSHHLLHHFPRTPTEALRPEFRAFRWSTDRAHFAAWKQGRTGYPIVDTGMRQLWATGWMHNRVRMIVASFLVKDLRIPWQEGARWFWDTLVDADLAQNTLGWQWTAGCGADAAPYFRVFNPAMQSAKFDADGDYIRRWCPELTVLPSRWIHQPDRAPADVLRAAGITLGRDYPAPVVDHSLARNLALAAYARIKSTAKTA